jgi:hypothetical protein
MFLNYWLERKVKSYRLKFEEAREELFNEVDPDEIWDITLSGERIQEIKEAGWKLKMFKERTEKEIKKEK